MTEGRRLAVNERKGGRDVEELGGWGSREKRRRESELLERASEGMLLRAGDQDGAVVAAVTAAEGGAEVEAEADAEAQRLR